MPGNTYRTVVHIIRAATYDELCYVEFHITRRTGRADFPHPALSRDHDFAHGRYRVVVPRRTRP